MENNQPKKKLNKKSVLKVIIAVFFIITFGIIISNHKRNVEFSEKLLGNLSNLGLVTESNNCVFYNKYEDGIVKVKNNKEYQITNETAYSMQIIDDIIYYLGRSDDGKLYFKSVKQNGDDKQIIKEAKTSISKFFIVNGNIYYALNGKKEGISRININSKEESNILLDKIIDFAVIEDKIYYTDNLGYLYKTKLDGTDGQILLNDEITEFQIYENWIYYFNENNETLNKIKDDGSEKIVVSDKINSFTFNIYKDKIYYYDSVNKSINCMNIDGSNNKTIKEISTNKTKINITLDENIYYLDSSKDAGTNFQMCRMQSNGGKLSEIKY